MQAVVCVRACVCDVCVRAHTCAVIMYFYIIDHSSRGSVDVSRAMGDNIKIVCVRACVLCVPLYAKSSCETAPLTVQKKSVQIMGKNIK